MSGSIQFINTTPEELLSEVDKRLYKHYDRIENNFQPKKPEEYIQGREVEKLLKISSTTRHAWSKKGILKKHGIGGHILYKRSEVEAALIAINE
ncbi:helix-turn-helix domain-containing protein [Muricauda sp. CAU 1633]|uniref:helix-turn-helix domain-containing protein n=1 Tax=Allomuricauda sp. CAU 1633 TaxID=2816036 RepID=UPI001A906F8A|nr:helix-turn-helix domain-containing protein [Muricauda sp. CAU 1633]MBO0323034.1 helix-turn-helix domain-containing protein [Muricauda sp. CAU 1633]